MDVFCMPHGEKRPERSSLRWVGFLLVVFLPLALAAGDPGVVPKEYERFILQHLDPQDRFIEPLGAMGLRRTEVGRSFALIAGIDSYPNLPVGKRLLQPAGIDVQKLVDYCRREEFFDEIVVLKNGDLTLDNLHFFLSSYFPARLRQFDHPRFFFALSCHGTISTGESYLVLSRASSFEDSRYLLNLKLLKILVDESVAAGHQSLVMINSCYGGGFLRTPYGDDPRPFIPSGRGAHAIVAGGSTEPVWQDDTVGEGSVFVEEFLRGVHGEADRLPQDNVVTADELGTFLKNRIQRFLNEKQNPRFGAIPPHEDVGQMFFLIKGRGVAVDTRARWHDATGITFGKTQARIDSWTGLTLEELDATASRFLYGMGHPTLRVVSVAPGSSAARAGMVQGDVVSAVKKPLIDGTLDLNGFYLWAEAVAPGTEGILIVARKSEAKYGTAEVTISRRP